MNDILHYQEDSIYSAFGAYLTISHMLNIKLSELVSGVSHKKIYDTIEIALNSAFIDCYDEMSVPLAIFGKNSYIELQKFDESYRSSIHDNNINYGKQMLSKPLNSFSSLRDLVNQWILNINNGKYD